MMRCCSGAKSVSVFSLKTNTKFLSTSRLIFSRKQALENDEKVVVVLLELGPLVGVQDIFEYEVVNTEIRADGLDQVDIGQALDQHPGYRLGVFVLQNLLHRCALCLFNFFRVVVKHRHSARGDGHRAHVHQ